MLVGWKWRIGERIEEHHTGGAMLKSAFDDCLPNHTHSDTRQYSRASSVAQTAHIAKIRFPIGSERYLGNRPCTCKVAI